MSVETAQALSVLVAEYADSLNLLMLKHEARLPVEFKDDYVQLIQRWAPEFEAKLLLREAERIKDGL